MENFSEVAQPSQPGPSYEGQRGFTLIEMTVAAVMFVIVLAAIMGLMEVARKARFNTMERGDDLQEVRIAVDQMAKDALGAGVNYSDNGAQVPRSWLFNNLNISPLPAVGSPGFLTPVIAGYQAGPIITGTTPTDNITFVASDPTFNPVTAGFPLSGAPILLTGVATATAPVLTVKAGQIGPCQVGDIYMVNNGTSPTGAVGVDAIGVVTAVNSAANTITMAPGGAGDPLGLNGPVNGTAGTATAVGQMAGTGSAGAVRINLY